MTPAEKYPAVRSFAERDPFWFDYSDSDRHQLTQYRTHLDSERRAAISDEIRAFQLEYPARRQREIWEVEWESMMNPHYDGRSVAELFEQISFWIREEDDNEPHLARRARYDSELDGFSLSVDQLDCEFPALYFLSGRFTNRHDDWDGEKLESLAAIGLRQAPSVAWEAGTLLRSSVSEALLQDVWTEAWGRNLQILGWCGTLKNLLARLVSGDLEGS